MPSRSLERTPKTLDSLLRGLPDDWVRSNEGGETWSPFDVIGHLIHGELTDWVPRARIILDHGEGAGVRQVQSLCPVRNIARTQPRQPARRVRDIAPRQFASAGSTARGRSRLDRKGRHPELGPVTLRQLLSTWVAHDLDHVVQVSRTLARQYTDEVGRVARLPARHQRHTRLIGR